jgi:hypothetical protein
MNKQTIHYFWILCEDGQEGQHSIDIKFVTCKKCLSKFAELDSLAKAYDEQYKAPV